MRVTGKGEGGSTGGRAEAAACDADIMSPAGAVLLDRNMLSLMSGPTVAAVSVGPRHAKDLSMALWACKCSGLMTMQACSVVILHLQELHSWAGTCTA